MSKRESITRYNLIIKKLRKHPATFADIAAHLAFESELQEYNFNISARTFQRDVVDIRSIYNIDIQYDNSRKVYYIDFDEQPEVNKRILEAFDTFNALNISDRLSNFIHFEKRPPQGTENLYGLLHAIKNNVQIKFTYQKFWEDEPSQRTTEPYALKEFKNRWYLLTKDHKDGHVKTFALDRLMELEITKTKFNFPVHFNVEENFRYCFGIISPSDEAPQEIILSFDSLQGKYIKTLPLHHSQQILVNNEKELQIKLQLCITHDFIMELLSYGDSMKVLQPKVLVDTIKAAHHNAFRQY